MTFTSGRKQRWHDKKASLIQFYHAMVAMLREDCSMNYKKKLFLLMTILSQTFFTLVSSNFMTF
ncbi:MAG: hypothetical protein ABIW38_09305, partial [Ferruginibacter sp.]